VPSESGPHRKYYGITTTGRSQLKKQRDDWHAFSKTVTAILTSASIEGVPA
jgi:PadR family transcriptional regulator, regulatory protein PadR